MKLTPKTWSKPPSVDHRLGGEQLDDAAVDVEVASTGTASTSTGSAIAIRTSSPIVSSGVASEPKYSSRPRSML